MSIPERLYRIAKYKLGELKDRLDRLDDEAQQEWTAEQKRRQSRSDARRELDDALAAPPPPAPAASPNTAAPAPQPRRTPEQIVSGARYAPAPSGASTSAMPSFADPLAYHYKLLSVEPGADFTEVQAAYNRLAARCDPSRFPAGSEEERQAQEIRARLEASFKALREALDPTARRFDLLEFDTPGPKQDTSPSS